MVIDAKERLTILGDKYDGNDALFKLKTDPRKTPILGTRRYSLDELPQMMNAFRVEMPLLSAGHPLPREVEGCGEYRRLLVNLGITGLGHVSDRFNRSREDCGQLGSSLCRHLVHDHPSAPAANGADCPQTRRGVLAMILTHSNSIFEKASI